MESPLPSYHYPVLDKDIIDKVIVLNSLRETHEGSPCKCGEPGDAKTHIFVVDNLFTGHIHNQAFSSGVAAAIGFIEEVLISLRKDSKEGRVSRESKEEMLVNIVNTVKETMLGLVIDDDLPPDLSNLLSSGRLRVEFSNERFDDHD